MCGIAGIASPSGITVSDLPAMGSALNHRGPDSLGYLLHRDQTGMRVYRRPPDDPRGRPPTVGFAHRRLSIIDVSEQNDQPVVDPTGGYGLSYNGELYNYVELRDELEARGHSFATSGDTEVVLHAYAEWGEECVQRFIGMWAFAILDLRRQTLFLSRDRFGIKPLFFTIVGDTLYFASEIKGLLAAKGIQPEPEERAVAKFLVDSQLDDTELTFFRGIFQLKPAHNLSIGLDQPSSPRIRRYWRIPREMHDVPSDPPALYRELLSDAIRIHARSDVPVGTCLSGGLDSSGIVCLAETLREAGQIPGYAHAAFGYVPQGGVFSERSHMEQVVNRTRVQMTYVTPTRQQFAAALPGILGHQDEPFGSASIAAQWFVFQAARDAGIKVMLDGQGADEVLGGYFSYLPVAASSLLREGRLVAYARTAGAHRRRFGTLPHSLMSVPRDLAPPQVRKAARRLRQRLDAHERASPSAAIVTPGLRDQRSDLHLDTGEQSSLRELLARDTQSANLPALLRYEDRNSMAHSIEARVPFLDHRLVELSFSLPSDWKIQGVTTKRVLREALHGLIPEDIRTRSDKIGFRADPAVTWSLASRHRDSIVAIGTPYEERWFDSTAVSQLLDSADRSADAEFLMWRVLTVKAWLRARWGDSSTLLS